mgnify:CR=1 FL=1
MMESLGNVAHEEERQPYLPEIAPQGPRGYSEPTAHEIDVAVRDIVKAAYDKALAMLARERPVLDRGAELLLLKETLGADELADLRRAMHAA